MNRREKYLIVVIGPTAIGKTARAIEIAQHFKCEIISCDSRQFYKEMTIGTAVPSRNELAAAQHHFIHNKSIFETYTVGDFEKEAIATLDQLFETSDFAVLVGGSGLYVDAVLKGFDDFPDTDTSIRRKLVRDYENFGISYLRNELERLDPDHYAVVDTGNPHRLMRALEVTMASGKPYSTYLSQKVNNRHFTPIIIGLAAERELMYKRISQRVEVMLGDGLVDEAKNLYQHRELNALQTVGYRELFDYFDGKNDLDFAIAEIKKNTRRFAKRQMTWFKRNESIRWFDFETETEQIISFIEQKKTTLSQTNL